MLISSQSMGPYIVVFTDRIKMARDRLAKGELDYVPFAGSGVFGHGGQRHIWTFQTATISHLLNIILHYFPQSCL